MSSSFGFGGGDITVWVKTRCPKIKVLIYRYGNTPPRYYSTQVLQYDHISLNSGGCCVIMPLLAGGCAGGCAGVRISADVCIARQRESFTRRTDQTNQIITQWSRYFRADPLLLILYHLSHDVASPTLAQ